ncbi:efflux RND transporter periplasmic adaptor subunit [Azospirillum sp. TSH100]|uniref:efflux RND transporter periplasmic adaptor subunit n=1 Tax=Azospirillum sp. TSH100 TaxID=652764 RepID=UPI001FFFB1F3|nr:efflux RND transporter periplasmic adaptor subunit [Azospirillum sp. TSH100]
MLGVGALLLLLSACQETAHQAGGSAQGAPSAPPPGVTTVVLHPHPVPVVTELPGRVTAFQTAEVRPQVGGVIRDRLFTEGQPVTAGQPLYQIDPASYQAALNSAIAAQQKSEAATASAQLTVNRYQPLAKEKAVSQQDLDTAVATLRQGQADVAAAKANVETARINLEYTKVRSPISGRTGRSSVTPGALVTAGQTTSMVTVTQLDPIYVDVTQPSSALLGLRRDLAAGRIQGAAGQAEVRLVLEDGREYDQPGTLQFSEVTVDQTTSSVTLRAVFPNPDGLLMPGMYVREKLRQAIDPKAFLVPQQAVARDSRGQAIVQVIRADGSAEARPVTADRTQGSKWVVTDGLSDGDRVVVEGLQKIRPGMKLAATDLTEEQFDQRAVAALPSSTQPAR